MNNQIYLYAYLCEDHKTSKSRILIIKQSRVDVDLTINTCFIKAMGLKLLESRFLNTRYILYIDFILFIKGRNLDNCDYLYVY